MIVLKNLISAIVATLYLLLILSCENQNLSSDTAKHNAPIATIKDTFPKRHVEASDSNQFKQFSETPSHYIDTLFGSIDTIEIVNDEVVLIVDLIEYYYGDKAIEEAKKRGEADWEITKEGDTIYFVLNDYYIVNDSVEAIPMVISSSTKIKLLEVMGDTVINFSNPQKSLERLKVSPFKIAVTKDNRIVYLEEIFIP